jgi:beta-mannosidase
MTEYGFQSFPEMRTVEAFTLPEDRTNIFTPVMLAHQKNKAGNEIIHTYMLRDYAEPKDFASFLYASQVLQAEGIKVGAEHLRRNRPRTMGSIYWQLNDCWPVASWSSIDYYGRWKALQYYARRFYAPLLVSPHAEEGNMAVYVVSDKTTATQASLRIRFLTFDGKLLSDKTTNITVKPLSSAVVQVVPMLDIQNLGADVGQTIAVTELVVGGTVVSSNTMTFVPTHEIHLPQAQIASELSQTGTSYRLHLSSPVLAKSVYVSFGTMEVKLSDNYFDLLPGQAVDVSITSAASIEELRSNMKVVSLVDAFAPHTAGVVAAEKN